MRQAVKTGFSGNVTIRHAGGSDQVLRSFNPFFMNIMKWPLAGILQELSREVIGVLVNPLGKIRDR